MKFAWLRILWQPSASLFKGFVNPRFLLNNTKHGYYCYNSLELVVVAHLSMLQLFRPDWFVSTSFSSRNIATSIPPHYPSSFILCRGRGWGSWSLGHPGQVAQYSYTCSAPVRATHSSSSSSSRFLLNNTGSVSCGCSFTARQIFVMVKTIQADTRSPDQNLIKPIIK